MENNINDEKIEKPINRLQKYIWFAISIVISVVGMILHNGDGKLPAWGIIVYASLLLFTIIMAAQKTSVERFYYGGDNGNKKKFILLSIVYYIFIVVAVFYVFQALWVSKILSI